MTEWFTGFIFLVKSAPQIFGTLVELKKLWDAYLLHEDKKEAMQMLGDSLNVARTQRDTTKLTDLVNRIINGQPLK